MFATSMRQPSRPSASQWRKTPSIRVRSSDELQFSVGKERTPIQQAYPSGSDPSKKNISRSGDDGSCSARRNQSFPAPQWLSVRSPTMRMSRACAAPINDRSASSPPSNGSTCSKLDAS